MKTIREDSLRKMRVDFFESSVFRYGIIHLLHSQNFPKKLQFLTP